MNDTPSFAAFIGAVVFIFFTMFIIYKIDKNEKFGTPMVSKDYVVKEIKSHSMGCKYIMNCVDERFNDLVVVDSCRKFEYGDTLILSKNGIDNEWGWHKSIIEFKTAEQAENTFLDYISAQRDVKKEVFYKKIKKVVSIGLDQDKNIIYCIKTNKKILSNLNRKKILISWFRLVILNGCNAI